MKLYQKIGIILIAFAWFLIFWKLSEYHMFKHVTTTMLKAMGVAGGVLLAFTALTGGKTDKDPE